jgi:hypothetical protein
MDLIMKCIWTDIEMVARTSPPPAYDIYFQKKENTENEKIRNEILYVPSFRPSAIHLMIDR